MEQEIIISTDKSKLDVYSVHDFLSNQSYWAKGRSIGTIQKSIENSLCFGVYEKEKQIGFARVVTDYAVFAWILDLFIIKEYRKYGFGKKLMDAIISHPDLQNLQRWGLATDDAHGLYEKYWFRLLEMPLVFMEKGSKPS